MTAIEKRQRVSVQKPDQPHPRERIREPGLLERLAECINLTEHPHIATIAYVIDQVPVTLETKAHYLGALALDYDLPLNSRRALQLSFRLTRQCYEHLQRDSSLLELIPNIRRGIATHLNQPHTHVEVVYTHETRTEAAQAQKDASQEQHQPTEFSQTSPSFSSTQTEIKKNPAKRRSLRRSPTREMIAAKLTEFLQTHQGEYVNLTRLAAEVGLSIRQTAHHYWEIAKQQPVPPIKKSWRTYPEPAYRKHLAIVAQYLASYHQPLINLKYAAEQLGLPFRIVRNCYHELAKNQRVPALSHYWKKTKQQ